MYCNCSDREHVPAAKITIKTHKRLFDLQLAFHTNLLKSEWKITAIFLQRASSMLSEQVYKKRQIPSSSMLKDKHGQLH